jgi:hypothetical protein
MKQMGEDTAGALADGFVDETESQGLAEIADSLEALKEVVSPEEWASLGGQNADVWIAAVNEAVATGDWSAFLETMNQLGIGGGEEVKEGFEDAIGGIGEIISAEMQEARAALEGQKIWEMLAGTDDEHRQAMEWIRSFTDPDIWMGNLITEIASSYLSQLGAGYLVPGSFLQQIYGMPSEFVPPYMQGVVDAIKSTVSSYGGVEGFISEAPIKTQLGVVAQLALLNPEETQEDYKKKIDEALMPVEGENLTKVFVDADTTDAEKSANQLNTDINSMNPSVEVDAVTQPAYNSVDSFLTWANTQSASVFVNAYGPGTAYIGSVAEEALAARTNVGKIENTNIGNIGNIPSFQHGGIVSQPTLARVGEVPEMIIPLEAISKIAGGGSTYNITIHDAYDAQRVAAQVVDAIREHERSKTRAGAYA